MDLAGLALSIGTGVPGVVLALRADRRSRRLADAQLAPAFEVEIEEDVSTERCWHLCVRQRTGPEVIRSVTASITAGALVFNGSQDGHDGREPHLVNRLGAMRLGAATTRRRLAIADGVDVDQTPATVVSVLIRADRWPATSHDCEVALRGPRVYSL
jgi:hypothetical protein